MTLFGYYLISVCLVALAFGMIGLRRYRSAHRAVDHDDLSGPLAAIQARYSESVRHPSGEIMPALEDMNLARQTAGLATDPVGHNAADGELADDADTKNVLKPDEDEVPESGGIHGLAEAVAGTPGLVAPVTDTLLKALPICRLALDRRGYIVSANQRAARLLGFNSAAEISGMDLFQRCMHPSGYIVGQLWETIQKQTELSHELRVAREDGTVLSVILEIATEGQGEDAAGPIHCILTDISSLRTREAELLNENAILKSKISASNSSLEQAAIALQRMSREDSITGLPNRRSATERIKTEFVAMKRHRRCYTILVVDVDRFNEINDRHGLSTSDSVLQYVAKIIRATVRESDFVARFGNDEFLVLLPDTHIDGAAIAAERLSRAIEAGRHPSVGRITVSIGASMASPDQSSFGAVLTEADECLRRAKRSGNSGLATRMFIIPPASFRARSIGGDSEVHPTRGLLAPVRH